MSRFRLPTFIAPVSIWRFSNWAGTVPPVNPPNVETTCNLTPGRRVYEEGVHPTSYILIPKATDIRFSESNVWSAWPPADPDLVEVPTGSGFYYTVSDTERVALGFANEHLEAALTKSSSIVTPPVVGPWTLVDAAANIYPSNPPGGSQLFLTSPSTPGDVFFLAVVCDNSSITGIVDDGGNSWALIGGNNNGLDCWLSVWQCITTNSATSVIALNGLTSNISMGLLSYNGPITGLSIHNSGTSIAGGMDFPFGPTTPFSLDLQLLIVGTGAGVDVSFSAPGPFALGVDIFTGASTGCPNLGIAMSANDGISHSGFVGITPSADWVGSWFDMTA